LTRELATLLQAGLPLDRALTVLAQLSQAGPVRTMIERLREKVRGGSTLADALSAYPDSFPNFYAGMVRAGEAGGTLDGVLVRLADSLDRAQALKESIRSALTYPALVVVMAVVSLAVLLTLVVPEFRALFEESGAALPLPTQILIGTSDFLQAYWWACLFVILAAIMGLRQHNRNPEGRLRWDRWMIGTPVFGDLIRKVEVARFSRTLGTLLANGVSVLPALTMTTGTLGNRAVSEAVGRAQSRLAKGEGLADPLAESGAFPGLALQLIRVGEETGQLEAMLLRIADIYDDEVKRSIQRMLSLLVPLVTIALGILIGGIMYSLLAAMLGSYDLTL
jgi:general secretion pathway protein F